MVESLPSEIDLFNLETKLRAMISELITPFSQRFKENDILLQKVLKRSRTTKSNLSSFKYEMTKCVNKMMPYEEFNKQYEKLVTETSMKIEEHSFDIAQARLAVDKTYHSTSDFQAGLRAVQEGIRAVKADIDDNYRYIREFQNQNNLELMKTMNAVNSFTTQQKFENENLAEKLNKVSVRISEINNKSLPELAFMLENKNVQIEEIKSKLENVFNDYVQAKDLKSLRNKYDYDIQQAKEQHTKEIIEVKSFLDRMLRLEISCGVTETLLQILDNRHLKKLIPFVESILSEDTAEGALALVSEFKGISTDSLYEKTRAQTKNLGANLATAKEKIKEEERKVPRLASIAIQKRPEDNRSSRKVRQSQRKEPLIFEESFSPEISISKPPEPTIIVKEVFIQPKVFEQSIVLPVTIPPPQPPPQPSPQPPPQHPPLTVVSEPKAQDLESEDYQKSSSRSYDPTLLQEIIEKLALEIQNIYQVIDTAKGDFQKALSKSADETKLSISIISRETNHFFKQRNKELAETNAQIERLQQKSINTFQEIEDLNASMTKVKDDITRCVETGRIAFGLLAQDEEDRQSIQLSCYAENKQKNRSPTKNRQPVSLKPECMTCSSQAPALYSAFKMACLNYCPSDVLYKGIYYPRKDLINKLGEVARAKMPETIFTEENFISTRGTEEPISRAKSAARVKNPRFILDASITRGVFNVESPAKRSETKVHKFNV